MLGGDCMGISNISKDTPSTIKKAVFDAGPFIHLHEIEVLKFLSLFKQILTTEEVLEECRKIKSIIIKISNVKQKELFPASKDFAKYLINRYGLDLGESTGIALCKQEQIKLFFTDDLEARNVAQRIGFEPHGSIAIILRSFREKIISKEQTKMVVENLYLHSSLFFTKDLKEWTIKEIEKFSDD